jgi:hypothetical protein
LLIAGAAMIIAAAAGCGGRGRASANAETVARPHTDATLQILSPTPNETTGPNVTMLFAVQGATVSPPDVLKIVPNQGHIHVSLDGKLIAMAYGTSTTATGLSPGPHTVQAEFVANDHLPFANRVVAAVIFNVA